MSTKWSGEGAVWSSSFFSQHSTTHPSQKYRRPVTSVALFSWSTLSAAPEGAGRRLGWVFPARPPRVGPLPAQSAAMVHYRRMVAAALHKLEEEARESGAPIDLGTGEGGGGGGERGDGVDDHVDDGSFHGSTAQQVGAMVLKLHAGDPQLDREDWYQRVRAALRGLTKDGEVDMLNLNRFRLAVEEEGDGVTWKLNVRFNDEDLMQVEVEVRANPDSDTPRLDPRREDARVATQRPIPPFSFAPREKILRRIAPRLETHSPHPPSSTLRSPRARARRYVSWFGPSLAPG